MINLKKITLKFISVSLLLIIWACSPEDRLVNNTSGNAQFLTLSENLNQQLSLLKLPNFDFATNNDIEEVNKLFDNKKINQIYKHLDKFYILVKNESKIYVFDNKLKNKQEIEISETSLNPKQIIFINATDAYVVYENSNLLGVVDIYYNKFVKNINFSNNILTFINADNYLFISMDNKSVVRYDIRTNQTTPPVNLRNNSNLINFNNKKEIMVFIDGDLINNLSATVLFLNKDDISKNEEFPLNFFNTNNDEFKFFKALNIENDYIFVTTNLGLLRFDNLNKTSTLKLDEISYEFCNVFNLTSEILLLNNTNAVSWLHFNNNASGESNKVQILNKKISKFLVVDL